MCRSSNGATADMRDARRDMLNDEDLKRLAPDLFDDAVKRRSLLGLRDVHREYDVAYTQYVRRKLQLEREFLGNVQPLLQRRKQLLDEAKLNNFWSVVFENCDTISENITPRDAVALRYLQHVSCESASEQHDGTHTLGEKECTPGSFALHFDFAPNPFFENARLSKTYLMCELDLERAGEITGCKIAWKSGKDLTTKTLRKKSQHGKTLVKKQKTDSFFNFFGPPTLSCALDEQRAAEIEEVLDADFEIAECIKEELIPRALLYYLDVDANDECDECDRDDGSDARDD